MLFGVEELGEVRISFSDASDDANDDLKAANESDADFAWCWLDCDRSLFPKLEAEELAEWNGGALPPPDSTLKSELLAHAAKCALLLLCVLPAAVCECCRGGGVGGGATRCGWGWRRTAVASSALASAPAALSVFGVLSSLFPDTLPAALRADGCGRCSGWWSMRPVANIAKRCDTNGGCI